MSSIEFAKLGDPLKARTAELAHEAGERAAEAANELLAKHEDVLGKVQISLIVERERELAARNMRIARAEGRANENRSLGLGMTVYVTESTLQNFKDDPEDRMEPEVEALLGPYLEAARPIPDTELYAMDFPEGMYSASLGSFNIYARGVMLDDGPSGIDGYGVGLAYSEVVRVEGRHGELWQNTSFTQYGRPRHTEQ